MGRILIGNVKGPAATVKVGNVDTGEPGSSAIVTNTGTDKDAVFDFTIPRGAQGQQGVQGPTGPMPPLINNLITNQAGAGALDAAQGKILAEKDAEIADQVSELNSKVIIRKNLPNHDLNKVTETGFYVIDYSIDDIQNAPKFDGISYLTGLLIVVKCENFITQTFFSVEMYAFRKNFYGWIDWYLLNPEKKLMRKIAM